MSKCTRVINYQYFKMSKKPETVFVPDEKIIELRRMFLEKMEREASKIPGKLGDQWMDLLLNGIECITRRSVAQ